MTPHRKDPMYLVIGLAALFTVLTLAAPVAGLLSIAGLVGGAGARILFDQQRHDHHHQHHRRPR